MIRSVCVFVIDVIINLLWFALIIAVLYGGCAVMNATLPKQTPHYVPVQEKQFDFDGVMPRMGADDY